MSAPAYRLDVDRVHVWRGDRHVLKGTSFALAGGELLHIWGPNGAGKTTLLRVVCGLLRPEQGTVAWLGQSIATVRADYQAALAYASHEPALKSDLTALENLRFTVGLKRRVSVLELRETLDKAGVGHAPICRRASCRPASAGASRSRAFLRYGHRCGCSMSPTPIWIRAARNSCRRCSKNTSIKAVARWSSRIMI